MGSGNRLEGLLSLVLESVSVCSADGFGYVSEPDGVEGLPWGAAVDRQGGLEKSILSSAVLVSRPGRNAMVHGVSTKRLDLIRGPDGALLGAAFFYDGPDNWESLKENLQVRHGKGKRNGTVRLWLGKKAHMALDYHKPTREGLLLMVSNVEGGF